MTIEKTCLLLLLLLQEPELLEVGPVEELVVCGGGGAAEILRGAGVLVLRLPSYVAAKTGGARMTPLQGVPWSHLVEDRVRMTWISSFFTIFSFSAKADGNLAGAARQPGRMVEE